jgi:hypothetical protein
MHFFHLASVFVLAAAASDSDLPDIGASPSFRINANPPPDHPLSYIQGWNLSSYHISPCDDRAVFYPNDTGRIFYVNGTDDEFADRAATLHTDGGTPPWPWSVSVGAPNEAGETQGRRPVRIGCGTASPGLQVAEWPGTVYYQTGTWYVCNVTLIYGPAIALFWREKVERTPADCLNVELQSWCLRAGPGSEREFTRNSTCYSGL